MYTNLVKDRLETLNSNFFLKSGVFLSRYQETDSFFWENFLKHLPEMLQNKHNLISLYSIHLNLRLKDKKNFEIISPRFDENLIKNAREKWKEVRNNEVKLTKISHTHNKIRIILEKKKVNFVIEYYDEYFVDIALPDSKICIEVNGPGHYLFPDVILNGRTENKRQNMEKLGWKLFSFPYFYYDDEAEDAIENFVNQIIPLCS
jgi:very-short-patch-repair endonuclease